jgi:hypothetical protein
MVRFVESMTRVLGLACMVIALGASSETAFGNGPRQPGVIGKPAVPFAKCDSCSCTRADQGKPCKATGCDKCNCQKSGVKTWCQ